jgi:LacI family transcriptional regulator
MYMQRELLNDKLRRGLSRMKTVTKKNLQVINGRPGSQHIADILGIARSTVVRALRSDPKIKADTIARVHAVAEQIGYKRNHIARSLASGRTGIVGCILPNTVNPYYAAVIAKIATLFSENEMSILLGITNDSDAAEVKYIESFLNYRVDGLLLGNARGDCSQDCFYALRKCGCPVAIIGEGEPFGIDSVRADDEQGAFDMICFLNKAGYRRIAFMGDLDGLRSQSWSSRLDGFRRGLLENNLRYYPEYLVNCRKTVDLEPALEKLLALPEPPDVMFAGNDQAAIELIHLIQRTLGLWVSTTSRWLMKSLPG